jgi:dihydroorotase
MGAIDVGKKANLVIINTKETQPLIAAFFATKAKYSPFDGYVSNVKIEDTIIEGKVY